MPTAFGSGTHGSVLAVSSTLDPAVANALRLGRRARERDAAGKLALLRRLQRQHVLRDLPLAERKTEQSFNEQLFARVLGYQTLLSHDEMPFHLLPQLHAGGNYADFSLGYFGGSTDDVVLASAELKGSDADLDEPQRGASYAGRSAVGQAFRTARAQATCRWVLVSNFRELRLYDIRNDTSPVAVARLDQIATRDELASLCAHFDRAALLGAPGKEPDLVAATDTTSPLAQLRARDGFYRITFRFVPKYEHEVPLFRIEDTFVEAVNLIHDGGRPGAMTSLFLSTDSISKQLLIPLAVRDGWLVSRGTHSDGTESKIAISRNGDFEVSLSLEQKAAVNSVALESVGLFIGSLIECVARGPIAHLAHTTGTQNLVGHLTAELCEVSGLFYEAPANMYVEGRTRAARATVNRIEAGDFLWAPSVHSCEKAVAEAICELAIQFRDDGGGVAVNHANLTADLAKRCVHPK